jgi:hypothetical protein
MDGSATGRIPRVTGLAPKARTGRESRPTCARGLEAARATPWKALLRTRLFSNRPATFSILGEAVRITLDRSDSWRRRDHP